jgi:hypothetical protein
VRKRARSALKRIAAGEAAAPATALGEQALLRARALEVLEKIGSPEARRLLARWAKARPETALSRDARVVLARLERRRGRTD